MCYVNVIQPFTTSDHCQVEFSVFTDCSPCSSEQEVSSRYYDWSKADYEAMSGYISGVDWLALLTTNLTADALWAAFSNVLKTAADLFVPVKYQKNTGRTTNKRWYPAPVRRAISRKRCLWRRYRRNRSDLGLAVAYRSAVQHCRQSIHKYEIKREQKVIDSNNAGCFFRFVNRKLSCKRGLGALINDNGDIVTSDIDRANLLNDYFTSVCTTDDGSKPAFDRIAEEDCNLDSVAFTPGRIYSIMRKLKSGGASGPDGLPPYYSRT